MAWADIATHLRCWLNHRHPSKNQKNQVTEGKFTTFQKRRAGERPVTGFLSLGFLIMSPPRRKIKGMGEIEFWRECPLVAADPEVKHGRVVFKNTRFVVEEAIDDVLANQEVGGMSEDEAIRATLDSHPTIPGAEALGAVIAYEAAHEHLLAP